MDWVFPESSAKDIKGARHRMKTDNFVYFIKVLSEIHIEL